MTRTNENVWWRRYFDQAFLELHEPLFPEEASRREVGAMLELLGLPAGSRVLDAPCGWGRHTRLFAEAGIVAYGADLSAPLLARAAQDAGGSAVGDTSEVEDAGDVAGGAATSAEDAGGSAVGDKSAQRNGEDGGSPPRYAAADLRLLPFADASFDAAVNIFTSLGLFLRDEEDVLALREVRRVLRPGGALLLESMHRDDVIRAYAERDRWTLPDGTEVRVRRRFDPVTGISREVLRWRRGEAGGEKRHALRLRTATEIDGLLTGAGFGEREYFGGWNGEPLRYDSPHVIVVARR